MSQTGEKYLSFFGLGQPKEGVGPNYSSGNRLIRRDKTNPHPLRLQQSPGLKNTTFMVSLPPERSALKRLETLAPAGPWTQQNKRDTGCLDYCFWCGVRCLKTGKSLDWQPKSGGEILDGSCLGPASRKTSTIMNTGTQRYGLYPLRLRIYKGSL